eukprot:TRINITY_DN18603_c0_g1_i10.p3 TRINITY_DN18603_c0_g1~~TRINITY_DN18603_c0_g1_i10.p3  ORF type:complete len:165 (-),score=1.78 TRINITY_DN18603_c0_g1_i10:362-856(-)
MELVPNTRRWSDPDYQAHFFFSRILLAFFNVCGIIDVYSDVALGLDIIRSYTYGFVFGIGILLLVLCAIDELFLVLRVLYPTKITIVRHVLTILIEVSVIAVTVCVIFGVQMDTGNTDEVKHESVVIAVISISTTVVNFLHHVFILYDYYLANSMLYSNFSILK